MALELGRHFVGEPYGLVEPLVGPARSSPPNIAVRRVGLSVGLGRLRHFLEVRHHRGFTRCVPRAGAGGAPHRHQGRCLRPARPAFPGAPGVRARRAPYGHDGGRPRRGRAVEVEPNHRLRDGQELLSGLPHLHAAVLGQPNVSLQAARSLLAHPRPSKGSADALLGNVLESAQLATIASLPREELSAGAEILHGTNVLEPALRAQCAHPGPLEIQAVLSAPGLLRDHALVAKLTVLAIRAHASAVELAAKLVQFHADVLVFAALPVRALSPPIEIGAGFVSTNGGSHAYLGQTGRPRGPHGAHNMAKPAGLAS